MAIQALTGTPFRGEFAASNAGTGALTTEGMQRFYLYPPMVDESIVSGSATNATLGADQNDYQLPALKVNITSLGGASRTITGIMTSPTGSTNGQKITIINSDATFSIFISHESASSTAANRIQPGTNGAATIPPGGSITLSYTAGSINRWRPVGLIDLASTSVVIITDLKVNNIVTSGTVVTVYDGADATVSAGERIDKGTYAATGTAAIKFATPHFCQAGTYPKLIGSTSSAVYAQIRGRIYTP